MKILLTTIAFTIALVTTMQAMEEHGSWNSLPAELHLTITESLISNDLIESLKNIYRFAQVDKNMYSIIVQNYQIIGKIVKAKFSKKEIADVYRQIINEAASGAKPASTIHILKAFFELRLVKPEEFLEGYKETPNPQKKLLLDETAIGLLLSNYSNPLIQESISLLLEYLINKRIFDVNVFIGNRLIWTAIYHRDADLAFFLINHGAHVYIIDVDEARYQTLHKWRIPANEVLEKQFFAEELIYQTLARHLPVRAPRYEGISQIIENKLIKKK